jgi:ADP-heptose:LPS heptosyltransferase
MSLTPAPPQNLLVVHIAGMSQSVLALPALHALRQHLPQARITVASSASAASLIELSGFADEVLPVGRLRGAEWMRPRAAWSSRKTLQEVRQGYFDQVIELTTNTEAGALLHLAEPRDALGKRRNRFSHGLSVVLERVTQKLVKPAATFTHDAMAYLQKLEPLGIRPTIAEPCLHTAAAANAQIDKLLTRHGVAFGELLIGIHPGGGKKKPRWDFDRFVSLAARMHNNFNARIVVVAGDQERGLARQLVRQLPLKSAFAYESTKPVELLSLLARCSLFVANHSGPAHLAAAAGVPVVVISPHPSATSQDVLGQHQIHLRAPHVALISEEAVYDAACQMLKSSRAASLSGR